jgi:hypothetical protein
LKANNAGLDGHNADMQLIVVGSAKVGLGQIYMQYLLVVFVNKKVGLGSCGHVDTHLRVTKFCEKFVGHIS